MLFTEKWGDTVWYCAAIDWSDAYARWVDWKPVSNRRCCGEVHQGYFSHGHFNCSNCGFKTEFDLSELTPSIQNRVKQVASKGSGIAAVVTSRKMKCVLHAYKIRFLCKRPFSLIIPLSTISNDYRRRRLPGGVCEAGYMIKE